MITAGTLWQLFATFLMIGMFSYGGGYVMIPLIQREIVLNHGWLTPEKFMDVIGVAEITPGPVSINSATFVGYSVGGVPGAVAATAGVVLPSLLVISILSYFASRFTGSPEMAGLFYNVRPVVVALIAGATLVVAQTALIDWRSASIAALVFLTLQIKQISPILVLLLAGLMGIVLF